MLARRMLVASLGIAAAALCAASLAWACAPVGGLVLSPNIGAAGTQVTATTSAFPAGETVELRWETLNGPMLDTVVGTGFGGPPVAKQITIPASASVGDHLVSAALAGEHAAHSQARAVFTVPAPAATPEPPAPEPPAPGPPAPGPSGSGSGQPVATAIPESPFAPLAPTGNTITGTSGNDNLKGTSQADVINCLAGNDVVNGGGGNDVINCGAGKDRVNGGAGNDKLSGGAGNDKLSGGAGKDKLMGGAGDDSLKGGAGKDKLMGGAGNDMLFRGVGDILAGGSGKNRMIG